MNPVALAQEVFRIEREALVQVESRIDDRFAAACDLVMAVSGRVVVLGMGKSGIVGRKVAATLSSTGTPALYVHPGEAFHGDLGMIRSGDAALMISNSGETEELIRVIPFLEALGIPILAFTARASSSLARHARVVLDVAVPREACANNLAPTSSSTAALVMGDALAVAVSSLRGFQAEDFARFHPGGFIGQKLLTRVADVMRAAPLPQVAPAAPLREVLRAMSEGGLGLTLVMEGQGLRGIVTDGDVRRAIERSEDPLALRAAAIMTPNPRTARPTERFVEVEARMLAHKINALVVVGEDRMVVGVVQIYDAGPPGFPSGAEGAR
jgi:arabinose-5-phosphate isomerase